MHSDLEKAVKILEAGGLVAIPTETVYGLAADAENEAAVKSIYAAKNRPATHPLIVQKLCPTGPERFRKMPKS